MSFSDGRTVTYNIAFAENRRAGCLSHPRSFRRAEIECARRTEGSITRIIECRTGTCPVWAPRPAPASSVLVPL